MNTTNCRILIIDDNPNIHEDFIKILSFQQNEIDLNALESKLFATAQPTANEQNSDQESQRPIFEIDTASQGQEGVEKIRIALEEGRPFALAFVDIRMPPGLDGIETIKHIWKLDKYIQIVICTAYSDYTWDETINELGMKDNLLILKKPFDITTVKQLAVALTKKWLLSQEERIYTMQLESQVETHANLLQKSTDEIHATLELSSDGILIVSSNNQIEDFNSKFITMWEIHAELIKNVCAEDAFQLIFHKLLKASKLEADVNDLRDKPNQIRSAAIYLVNGQIFEYYTQPHEFNGKSIGRIWSFRDITQRIYLEKELEIQRTYDTLTHLPNRALLIDRIKHSITDANRQKCIFALLFIDIDNFKKINDSLGNTAGDELLLQFVKRVSREVRESDTLARLDGDKFVLMLPGIKNDNIILHLVNRILQVAAKPFEIFGRTIHITATIGIAVYPKDGNTPEELIRSSDLATYKAKREGINKFKFYEEALHREVLMQLEKEIELRRAIDNNEFILHFQPQIDINSNKIVGVEALIRWLHPTLGLVYPVDFINIAESAGLMQEIGKWVMITACKQNKAWQTAGLPKFRIAVNASHKQINDPQFASMVLAALNEATLDANYLEIEITEESVIDNNSAINTIKELSKFGVRVVFDDFGTGNSSLHYLRITPINQLKIDRSFIRNININESDETIIRAIISIAADLNLDVVAEGVETEDQLEFLKRYRCNVVQGYYFSKPLTSDGLEEYIRANKL